LSYVHCVVCWMCLLAWFIVVQILMTITICLEAVNVIIVICTLCCVLDVSVSVVHRSTDPNDNHNLPWSSQRHHCHHCLAANKKDRQRRSRAEACFILQSSDDVDYCRVML